MGSKGWRNKKFWEMCGANGKNYNDFTILLINLVLPIF